MSQKATDKYKELKKEVSRLASLANKRIKRLERNELTETNAYKAWEKDGKVKFSVRGKDYNQLQSEYFRLKKFVDAKSSTVRGAINVLRDMAKNTGIKYNSVAELKANSKGFFTLQSKLEQYLTSIGMGAQAIAYQRLWQAINQTVKEEKIDLSDIDNIEGQINKVIARLEGIQRVEQNKEGYPISSNNYDFIDL